MVEPAARKSPETEVRSLQQQIGQEFPDLTVTHVASRIYIRGAFPVLYQGAVLDRYQIEIEWSDSDTEAPILRETGGRIPRTADRHMNADGKACPLVQEEWLIRPREARSLPHYLSNPVHDYFLWQTLTERGIAPQWGQRSHGIPGLIEAYGEMVGMEGEKPTRKTLSYLSKKKIKGHWPCVCDSGRLLRDCHFEHLRRLQAKIPRHIVLLAQKRLADPFMR